MAKIKTQLKKSPLKVNFLVVAGPSVYVGERVSTAIWHSRLGHPASIVFHHLISAFKLTIDGNSGLSSVCTEC